jgi:peptide/nickel transport system permease protein
MSEIDIAMAPPTAPVEEHALGVVSAPAPEASTERSARGGGRAIAWRVLRRPGLVLAGLWIVLVTIAAFVPSWLTSYGPLEVSPRDRLQSPSWEHLFGTDQLGRDLFARTVYGAQLSMRSALLAVAVGLVVGGGLGLVAGFARGWLDDVVMRVVDVVLAIPSLLLSLALITVLGFGTTNVAIAVGIASVAACARIMRSEVLRVRESTFVEAAHANGVRWSGVLLRHVLPNSIGPLIVLVALEFGTAILAISALSFLGYGAPPPIPEWGSLVATGRDFLREAWWLTTLPGLVVAATVLAANRISRALDRKRGRG